MRTHTLSASGFRMILIICLFVVAAIGTVLFWLTDDYLRSFAIEVNHTTVDSNASQSNVQTLQQLKQKLTDNKAVVDRASSIVADSKSYQYQDQIIKDLNDYAAKAGITITNLDFSGAAPSTAGTAQSKSPAVVTPVISGVKSVSVNVTLKNPVKYNNMLSFIQSIEQNLTKMQISKISLAKDAATGNVTSEAFTVEVYTR
jgi:hypothetical protein